MRILNTNTGQYVLSASEQHKVSADEWYKSLDLSTASLDVVRQAKINQLLEARDNKINSEFTSSTTGHTYYWAQSDQQKVHGQITLLNLDSTITSVDWLTKDAGIVTHTKDQFIAVFKEGGQFERNQHTKFYQLESQVNDPITDNNDKVNVIVW